MLIILHRVNTIESLQSAPTDLGVEVDIRSNGDDLIINHDPFQSGDLFEEWIQYYHHKILILNVKEEGLEEELLKLMDKYKINNFFFLDQSFPFLRKTAINGEKRCAVRLSEYESIDTVLSLTDMVNWVWIDCFTHFPLDINQTIRLKEAGFKLCFVSPELQGRTDPNHVKEFRREIEIQKIIGDAVCTKYSDLWA